LRTSLRIISILVLSILLLSCETVALKPEERDKIRNIGVVSLIDEVEIYRALSIKVAFSFSEKEFRTSQNPGWDINKLSEDVVKNTIKTKTGISVINLNYNYKELQPIYNSNPFTSEINTKNHKPYLREIVKGKDIDAILVISKCNCGDYLGGDDNDLLSGLGVYSKVWGKNDIQYATFASLRITLLDSKTFEVIATNKTYDAINHRDSRFWSTDLKSINKEDQEIIIRLLATHTHNVVLKSFRKWGMEK